MCLLCVNEKGLYTGDESYCRFFVDFVSTREWWGTWRVRYLWEGVLGKSFLGLYWCYGLEKVVIDIRQKLPRPNLTLINPLKPHGNPYPINIPKTDRLWMGLNNIFSILHNNNALQRTSVIFEDHIGLVFLRWRELNTFFNYTYDENARR